MADPSVVDLNFGHVGQAVYDSETREWLFNRTPGRRHVLKSVGFRSTSIAPSARHDHPAPSRAGGPRRLVESRTQWLVRNYPELVPAIELLPSLVVTSMAITSTIATYDPVYGDLMAFGRAADVDAQSGKGRIHIAAISSGENGEILRLVRVREERRGWGWGDRGEDKSVWLEVQTLGNGECGWWAGDGVPIRQISFAHSEDRATLLAVRLPTMTVIFRPLYHASPVTPRVAPLNELPASRLNPNPVLSLRTCQTGGVPHAHITFNPWYQHQIAVVDEEGGWTIWDIAGRQSKQLGYTLTCSKKGKLAPLKLELAMCEPSEEPHDRGDGWARIFWIGNVNTIVVCNRRQMALFDIRGEGEDIRCLKCPDLAISRTTNWILDVRKSPQNQQQFVVLTSSYLYLLETHCLDEWENNGIAAGAVVTLSWRHFRGIEDVTLQLSLLSDGEETQVLLYSRLNTLVTVFRFSQSIDEQSFPISVSDPMELRLPNDFLQTNEPERTIMALSLDRLHFGGDERYQHGGPGRRYRDENVTFYNLTSYLSDYSVNETLFYSLAPETQSRSNSSNENLVVEAPTWRKERWGARDPSRKPKKDSSDSFIVPNVTDRQMRYGSNAPGRTNQHSVEPSMARKAQKTNEDDFWTISNEFTYRELAKNVTKADNEDENSEAAEETVSILDQIKNKLDEEVTLRDETLGTLFDFANSLLTVANIDDASSKLQELLQLPSRNLEVETPSLEIRAVASDTALQLINLENEELSMARLYDDILRVFIAPLPHNMPRDIRQAKERIARRLAAEIVLASHRIRYTEPVSPSVPAQVTSEASQTSGYSLPVRSSGKGKEQEASVMLESSVYRSQPTSSQPVDSLPTPETTPSLISASSFTSSSSGLGDNPLNRLKQHLHISKSAVKPHLGGNKILMHWQGHFGQDPSTYDWVATTRAMQEASDAEGEGLSASQRARLQRKAERHLKRQRRETAAAAARSASQPLHAMELAQIRSSPGPMLQRTGSSQPVPASSQVVVASQVERGVFGGRSAAKKVKKAKIPGFR